MALDFYKTTVALIGATVWPVLIGVVLLLLRTPLLDILRELPAKLSAATKLGVGSLSLEIQYQARAFGNPELARRLGRLSPEAIRRLIETGESQVILVGVDEKHQRYFIPEARTLDTVRELARNGLVSYREDLEEFVIWLGTGPFRRSKDTPAYITLTRELTESERKRFRKQQYVLTDLGRKAWDAVLQAVLEQLRSPTGQFPSTSSPQVPSSTEP